MKMDPIQTAITLSWVEVLSLCKATTELKNVEPDNPVVIFAQHLMDLMNRAIKEAQQKIADMEAVIERIKHDDLP